MAVLADGQGSAKELWILTAAGIWQDAGGVPGATALSRAGSGLAIASGHSVDVRAAGDPSHTGTVTALKWPGQAPSAPIVDLDATGPAIAFVTADETSVAYATAGADGTVTPVTPAPVQPFTPLVAWLDASRLLVLTTDQELISRLAVLDVRGHSLEAWRSLAGVREFAVSGDRQTVAMATGAAIFVSPASSIGSTAQPESVATLGEAQVVWALALDSAGSEMFMLSGTVAADGTVGSVREIGYSRHGSTWVRVVDEAVPFDHAAAQICLS